MPDIEFEQPRRHACRRRPIRPESASRGSDHQYAIDFTCETIAVIMPCTNREISVAVRKNRVFPAVGIRTAHAFAQITAGQGLVFVQNIAMPREHAIPFHGVRRVRRHRFEQPVILRDGEMLEHHHASVQNIGHEAKEFQRRVRWRTVTAGTGIVPGIHHGQPQHGALAVHIHHRQRERPRLTRVDALVGESGTGAGARQIRPRCG